MQSWHSHPWCAAHWDRPPSLHFPIRFRPNIFSFYFQNTGDQNFDMELKSDLKAKQAYNRLNRQKNIRRKKMKISFLCKLSRNSVLNNVNWKFGADRFHAYAPMKIFFFIYLLWGALKWTKSSSFISTIHWELLIKYDNFFFF